MMVKLQILLAERVFYMLYRKKEIGNFAKRQDDLCYFSYFKQHHMYSILIITSSHLSSRSFSPPPSRAGEHAVQGLPISWLEDWGLGWDWRQQVQPI